MLRAQVPKPEEMKQEAYDRTLRARAFDGARYLLPLAANTSLGEIVNARTLETQVSRLLSQPHAEVRRLGEKSARGCGHSVHGTCRRRRWKRCRKTLQPSIRRWATRRGVAVARG